MAHAIGSNFEIESSSERRNLFLFKPGEKNEAHKKVSMPSTSSSTSETFTRSSIRTMLDLDQTFVFNQSLTGPNGFFFENSADNQMSRTNSFSKRRNSLSSEVSFSSSASLYNSSLHESEEKPLDSIPEVSSSPDSNESPLPNSVEGSKEPLKLSSPENLPPKSLLSFAPSSSKKKDLPPIPPYSPSNSLPPASPSYSPPASPSFVASSPKFNDLSSILRILTTETVVSIEKQGTPTNFKVNGNMSIKLGSVPMNVPLLIFVLSSVRHNIAKISADKDISNSLTIEKSPDQTFCLVLDTQSINNLREDPLIELCKYQLISTNSSPLFRVKSLVTFLPKNEKNSIEKIRIMVQVALNRQLDIVMNNVKIALNLSPVLKEIEEDFNLSKENFNFSPTNGVLDLSKKNLNWEIASIIPSEKPVLELLIQINIPGHPPLNNFAQSHTHLPLNIRGYCEKNITDFKINVPGIAPEKVLHTRKINFDYRFL